MSEVNSLTVAQCANQFGQALSDWASLYGGKVKLMANLKQLWQEVLEQSLSSQPRILICWTGSTARGGFKFRGQWHREDRDWVIVVMRGKGWTQATQQGTVTELAPGSEMVFTDVVEQVRDKVRVILSVTAEWPLDYKGVKPLPNIVPGAAQAAFLDGMALEFSTANDIPGVIDENPVEPDE